VSIAWNWNAGLSGHINRVVPLDCFFFFSPRSILLKDYWASRDTFGYGSSQCFSDGASRVMGCFLPNTSPPTH
jgi:hypothetical protein